MWRRYFGRRSSIVGIDIEPRVAQLAEKGISIHVGDQADPEFLRQVTAAHGGWDIVIDDGSHLPQHQIASIGALWSSVSEGGLCIVEDLHSNYWSDYGGGVGVPTTFMVWLSHRIDNLHAFHSRTAGCEPNEWTRTVSAIHIYDSVAVVVKGTRDVPLHRKTGRPSFEDVYGVAFDDVVETDHLRQLQMLNRPAMRLKRLCRHPVATVKRVFTRVMRD
jgi:hypothetical protein